MPLYSPGKPYGVMFHHFWDKKHPNGQVGIHPNGQGAITADEFEQILHAVGIENILPAQDFYDKAVAGTLQPHETCLTFDDALLCQYDIALPVMEAHNLTAFWFVYSSVFQGNKEVLEIYRYFRSVEFNDFLSFYNAFFEAVKVSPYAADVQTALADFNPDAYLKGFDFYTTEDRIFRYVRDKVLGVEKYNQLMDQMIEAAGYDWDEMAQNLWMTEAHLKNLHAKGHVLGLHSHTHPMVMGALPKDQQTAEYSRNFSYLSSALGQTPKVMSHPCNSYNQETLDLLTEMGITLGFRANMQEAPAGDSYGPLELPREDHINILKLIHKKAA